MDKSVVEVKIKSPDGGKLKRTISDHDNVEDLINQINDFINETNEAIEAGNKLTVTCCSNWRCFFKKCFKTKVKTGDNKISTV